MKTIKLLFILALASTMLSSCATIFTGTRDNITVNSDVPAQVRVDGNPVGSTPVTINAKRGNTPVITVEKEGYETVTIKPEKHFNAVAILNLFNVVFWGIDFATGAAFRFDQKYYMVEMRQKDK